MLGRSLFFLVSFLANLLLVYLFSLKHFVVYFFTLLIVLYILYKNYLFSYKIFLFYTFLIFIVLHLEIYSDLIFKFHLYTNTISSTIYIDSDIMYGLSALNLFFLINLKKIESFWAIIDKKLGF